MNETRIVLASGSPRRRELLSREGVVFDVIVSDADETSAGCIPPALLACSNARAKALAVAQDIADDAIVIGADTIVVLERDVYGKPADKADAERMLRELSGRTHQVVTGVCLAKGDMLRTFSETTDVVFRELTDEEIAGYVESGEPLDKAGAYGIQGLGGALVDHIEGDYDNVVGLPVTRVIEELEKL